MLEHFYNKRLEALRNEVAFGNHHQHPQGKRPHVLFAEPELAADPLGTWPVGSDQPFWVQSCGFSRDGEAWLLQSPQHGRVLASQIVEAPCQAMEEPLPAEALCLLQSPLDRAELDFSLDNVMTWTMGLLMGAFLSAGTELSIYIYISLNNTDTIVILIHMCKMTRKSSVTHM